MPIKYSLGLNQCPQSRSSFGVSLRKLTEAAFELICRLHGHWKVEEPFGRAEASHDNGDSSDNIWRAKYYVQTG